MARYEYKVVPAPNRAIKVKGVRGTQARFAHALETLMNDAGQEGWEYLRADTMPCQERQGLGGRVSVDQHVLVFRRELETATPPHAASNAPVIAGVTRQAPAASQADDTAVAGEKPDVMVLKN